VSEGQKITRKQRQQNAGSFIEMLKAEEISASILKNIYSLFIKG